MKVISARPTLEGAGVHLKRVFGFHDVPQFDPFLLLDDFHSKTPEQYLPGFPWHPHRGIETITYVIEGEVEHGDSMGNKGVICSGDVQWMTAGSGIIHQEMPKGDNQGKLWGFQLWANLPASHKMMDPRYREVVASEIPSAELPDGIIIKVVAGTAAGITGPVKDIVIEPEYLDVSIPAGKSFLHSIPSFHTAFAYVIEGAGYFDSRRKAADMPIVPESYFHMKKECLIGPEHLVFFDMGKKVEVSAGSEKLRFLFVSGKPLKEPVAWWGPIVMNTRDELETAFREFDAGTFIKK
ncbi:MAG: pirin family protein [Spirochaetales bacterium]|nr:pirin family protein [Spirochaetales bacterium]